ncbi:ferritin-like domain-containing protein [Candidimonas humi]|uniref:Ferritin-like domain-containing protein n=1 Tax=Candidimonas humi TaxID=683355 RepID=A0ABV8NWC3_9BURK|nr:ferritin-like domain-containing protein [Candidimonas humi]MBV6304245.1 ferritin-like domain-containing protein [Candidimonas humi]
MRESIIATPHWNLDHVPYDTIDRAQARAQPDMLYLVAAASFVEIASDLYTDNLVSHFENNAEIVGWLREKWQTEEVRHGKRLRDYVRHVWPEFDWDTAYAAFYADYGPRCTVEALEPQQSLEMVARCVVETGTATFYQALAAHATEPVLSGIAARIRSDEINHYKHFYGYFRMYDASQPPGRLRVLGALKRRVLEVRNDDVECALWHAYATSLGPAADKTEFRALRERITRRVRRHYPVTMAAKMLLKPLSLPAPIAHLIQGPMARLAGWLIC